MTLFTYLLYNSKMLSQCLNILSCCKENSTITLEFTDDQIINKSTNIFKEFDTPTLKSSTGPSLKKETNLSTILIENGTIKCQNSPGKLTYLRGQTMSFKKCSSNQSVFTFNNCKTEKFVTLRTIVHDTSQKLDFVQETKIKKLKVNLFKPNEIFTIDHKGGDITIKSHSRDHFEGLDLYPKRIKITYDDEKRKYYAKCEKFPLHIKIFSSVQLTPGKKFSLTLGKEPIEIQVTDSNDVEIKTIHGNHKFNQADTPIRIGRSNSNSVYLEDPSVSKLHALIDFVDSSYLFRDNNSTNGSDRIIQVGEEYPISTINVFSMGDDNFIRIDEFVEN